jgi:hypothetical protein
MDRFTRLAIISKFDKANDGNELLALADQVVEQMSALTSSDTETSTAQA